MAKVQKKSQTATRSELKVLHINAGGIDISPKEMQVCVPADRAEDNNRTFGVFTKDLEDIAKWLKECGVDTVAMESTGVYWIPIFKVLKESGFEVLLVDPRMAKNYSGKKTDESDAEWLMLLHRYGLLKPCFQPDNIVRKIRNLTRHRDNLIRSGSREVLHLQKEMEQMNLKLDNVFSDILGKSGQAIITAIIEGERDPEKLAAMADWRCKNSKEEIMASLQATWDEDHLFVMKQCQELFLYYKKLIAECEAEIDKLMGRACVDKEGVELLRSNKQKQIHNDVSFDIEKHAFNMWGVNIMRIPGMSKNAALRLTSELGPDFVSKFPDAKHFASWANLVPNNKVSGGKVLSSRVPHKNNPVGQVLRQCANSLNRADNPMGEYFRHIRSRSGYLPAMVATGKKLATILYTMVKNQQEYDSQIYCGHHKATLERQIEKAEARLNRLLKMQARAAVGNFVEVVNL